MAVNIDELLETISKMTILEVSELVKAMEDKFGISAAAPIAQVASAGEAGAQSDAPQEEEKANFDVVLKSVENKMQVIKAVKTITGLGLIESKNLVESLGTIKQGVPKAEAEEMKTKIEEAGATIELA